MAAVIEVTKYLEKRQLLKDRIRREIRRGNRTSAQSTPKQEKQNETTARGISNWGSFFGPSETVISKRVIRESKNSEGKVQFSALTSNGKLGFNKGRDLMAKEHNQAQRLKDTRDYSFLSSDEDKPTTILPSKSDYVHTSDNCKSTLPNSTEPKKLQKQTMLSKSRKTTQQQKSLSLFSKQERPKKAKTDCDESERALMIIRKMFNTDRFAGRDDSDVVMESSFGDITKEEKRSLKLAREADREQERLIQEEESKGKMAKKRKLYR